MLEKWQGYMHATEVSPMEDEPQRQKISGERLEVWELLSELFLDQAMGTTDYDRIAKALASTSLSTDELTDILRFEVHPVCSPNLLSVAGEWQGFSREWLREKISPHYEMRPGIRLPALSRGHYRDDWDAIVYRIEQIRGG